MATQLIENEMPSPSGSPSPDYIQSQNIELLANANNSLIPTISEPRYQEWFNKYDTFCRCRQVQYSQESLLMYLQQFAELEEPGHKSMYSYSSGIKSILTNSKNVNTKNWGKVKSWLKKYAKGKTSTKKPTFTTQEMHLFRTEAPVPEYTRHRLAEGFGTYGRLRAQDYPALYYNKCTKEGKKEKIDIFDSYAFIILNILLNIFLISYI